MTRASAAVRIGIFIAALVLGSPAAAAASCSVSATSISFGSYSVFSSAPTTSTATVTYECLAALTVSVSLTKGQSDTFAPRVMGSGGERLAYNLYRDPSYTVVWGDGSAGTQTHVNSGATVLSGVTLTVYGRIPAGQDVAVGAYTDNVTVVINF